MELWDLYDKNRQPLFRTHQRGKKMNPGEHHIVVEVWTVNSKKEILVTLRDHCKEDYPDKWENTGGSALAGETSKQAAIRELMEETGIIALENNLILLGTYQEESAFVDIYLLRRDILINQLKVQDGETVDARWISLEELDNMIADQSLDLPTGKRFKYVEQCFLKNLRIL